MKIHHLLIPLFVLTVAGCGDFAQQESSPTRATVKGEISQAEAEARAAATVGGQAVTSKTQRTTLEAAGYTAYPPAQSPTDPAYVVYVDLSVGQTNVSGGPQPATSKEARVIIDAKTGAVLAYDK